MNLKVLNKIYFTVASINFRTLLDIPELIIIWIQIHIKAKIIEYKV